MKKSIALFMLLFFVGIGTANEKTNEAYEFNDSMLVCWSMSYSVNTSNDTISFSGTPAVIMTSEDYINIQIWDMCGNLVYHTIKVSGSNSGIISKSSFTNNICFGDVTGNQDYYIVMEWYSFGCSLNSISGTIHF